MTYLFHSFILSLFFQFLIPTKADLERAAEAAKVEAAESKLSELEQCVRDAERQHAHDASALAELRKELASTRTALRASQANQEALQASSHAEQVSTLDEAHEAHAAVVKALTEAHSNQLDDMQQELDTAQREREDALSHATSEQLARVAAEKKREEAVAEKSELERELKQLQSVHSSALKVLVHLLLSIF
jgi:chromosome segregation ATPase